MARKHTEETELAAGGTTRGDPVATGADDFKTEQEKSGPDPVGDPVNPKPLEELEIIKVAPREPYPSGAGPDPEDQFEAAHGFRRAKE
jgi:hypothetical protein